MPIIKGGNTFGEELNIPLLEELDIIFSTTEDPIILIDDMRIFGCPAFFKENNSVFFRFFMRKTGKQRFFQKPR